MGGQTAPLVIVAQAVSMLLVAFGSSTSTSSPTSTSVIDSSTSLLISTSTNDLSTKSRDPTELSKGVKIDIGVAVPILVVLLMTGAYATYRCGLRRGSNHYIVEDESNLKSELHACSLPRPELDGTDSRAELPTQRNL